MQGFPTPALHNGQLKFVGLTGSLGIVVDIDFIVQSVKKKSSKHNNRDADGKPFRAISVFESRINSL